MMTASVEATQMNRCRVIGLTSLKTVAHDTNILSDALRDECAFARASHSHHRHNDIFGTRSKVHGLERFEDVRHEEYATR